MKKYSECFLANNQERNGHINLRKIPGHLAGQTGVSRPVSQGLPVVLYKAIDREEHLCRDTRPGVRGTPGRPGFFSEILCDCFFLYVPFLLPQHRGSLGARVCVQVPCAQKYGVLCLRR